jgi:hypothetical protein
MEPGHWIIITLIVAWALVMLGGMWQANQKELQKHRERLAMIEKGLPLAAEPLDASAGSRLQSLMGVGRHESPEERERKGLEAVRFLGMLTIGVGVGLFFLLIVLDEWKGAVAIGGLLVIVGTTLILTTMRALRVRMSNGD